MHAHQTQVVPVSGDVFEDDALLADEAQGADAVSGLVAVEAARQRAHREEHADGHPDEGNPLDTQSDVEESEHGSRPGADGKRQQEERAGSGHLADREGRGGDQPDPPPEIRGFHFPLPSPFVRKPTLARTGVIWASG